MMDHAKKNIMKNVMLSSIVEEEKGTFTVMLP
jgi:preprotein translocase subunit SecA